MAAVAELPPKTFQPHAYYIRYGRDFTAGSATVAPLQPKGEASEQLVVATKLGKQGFQRIQQFRAYGPGWDFGRGLPMSEAAYRNLVSFLTSLNLAEPTRPSVFLTSEGNLELSWENQNGGRIQVEFGTDSIGYFNEEQGIEVQFALNNVTELAQSLSR